MAVEEPVGDSSLQVVAAIVHHTGRVLAIERHGDGRRGLPRGFALDGETPTEALRRITRSLTGLAVVEAGVTGIHRAALVTTVTFRCFIRGVGPDFSDETTALHWCAPSELAALGEASLHGALLRALQLPADGPSSRPIDVAGLAG